MSTNAERQRKRRERLRGKGIVDVTVSVPLSRRETLRHFAQELRSGSGRPFEAGPLLKVIKALKTIRPELEEAGVVHAGVFGSAARGEYRPSSDIDILIDVDAGRVGDIIAYIKITDDIKKAVKTHCPGVGIDVADHASLKPRVREDAERDAIYAF